MILRYQIKNSKNQNSNKCTIKGKIKLSMLNNNLEWNYFVIVHTDNTD